MKTTKEEITKGMDSVINNLVIFRKEALECNNNYILKNAFKKDKISEEEVKDILFLIETNNNLEKCCGFVATNEFNKQGAKYKVLKYKGLEFVLITNRDFVTIKYIEDLSEVTKEKVEEWEYEF